MAEVTAVLLRQDHLGVGSQDGWLVAYFVGSYGDGYFQQGRRIAEAESCAEMMQTTGTLAGLQQVQVLNLLNED
jgi:hypothetical protein